MIRHTRLTALGIILCLLAALFAVEAKIAWFSPAGSAGAQLSAAKARPAEQPKMLPVRLARPDLAASDFAGMVALLVGAFLPSLIAAAARDLFPDRPQVAGRTGFDAALCFRPPPVR